jgi:hypothetical protein
MSIVNAFRSLAVFMDHAGLDRNGVKVVIEVDGVIETELFSNSITNESAWFMSPRAGSMSRLGTINGVAFEVRTSPRCPQCHK